VDTIGDAYVVVAGLGLAGAAAGACCGAEDLLALALDMRRAVRDLNAGSHPSASGSGGVVLGGPMAAAGRKAMAIRIGVGVGPVVAGVIGERQQRFQVLGPALAWAEALQRQAGPWEIRVQAEVVASARPGDAFRFASTSPLAGPGGGGGLDAEVGWTLVSARGSGGDCRPALRGLPGSAEAPEARRKAPSPDAAGPGSRLFRRRRPSEF
jgi:hypothetical protein